MIGKVYGYDDNTDAFRIVGNDGNDYYALSHAFKYDVRLDDLIYFECVKVLCLGDFKTLLAGNIFKINDKDKYFILKYNK